MSRKNRNQQRRSTPYSRGKPTIAMMLIVLIGLAGSAAAQECVWIATDGGWNTTTNWDTGNVPNAAGEWAVIPDGGGSYAIDLNGNLSLDYVRLLNPSATIRTNSDNFTFYHATGLVNHGVVEVIGGSGITGHIENVSGGQITIDTASYLLLYGPTVNNSGNIQINDIGSGDAYIDVRTPTTLSGPGELLLNGSDHNTRIQSTYAHLLTHGSDHTIRGLGRISGPLTNHGTINADQAGGILSLTSRDKSNDGLLTATNGSELVLTDFDFDNTDGTVLADGGDVLLDGVHIVGGLLDATGSSIFRSDGPWFADLTIGSGAWIDVISGGYLYVDGTSIVNDGTIRVNDAATADAIVEIRENMTLSGMGELLLNGDNQNDRINATYGHTIAQGADHTIRGFGGITAPLVNHGTVDADQSGGYLRVSGSAKSNDGLFRASNGSELQIQSTTVTNTGGTISADGGTVAISSGATIIGGSLASTDPSFITVSTTHLTDVLITGGSWVDVLSGSDLLLHGTETVNNGTIRVNEAGTLNAAIDVDDDLSISGTGEILLNGDDQNDRIESTYGYTLTQEAAHTVRGFGGISCGVVNHGTIDADDPDGFLRLYSTAKSNDGLIKASGGGELQIYSTTIDNTGGVISAAGGNVRVLNSANVVGGTLVSAEPSIFITETANLTDVTIAPNTWIDARTGYDLFLWGTEIVNDGTIRVNDSGTSDAFIDIREDVTISGSGQILLNGDNQNDRIEATYGHNFTQGPGHTIRGFGGVYCGFTNHGSIHADDPTGYLTIYGSTDKSSDGVIRASNGSELRIATTIDNTDGLILADGGRVLHTGRVDGGVIDRTGSSVMRVESGRLADVTIAETGWVDVASGTRLYFNGSTIVNNGTIRVNDQGTGDASIDPDDPVTISGTGDILLNGDSANDRIHSTYSRLFIQEAGHTIHGKGNINSKFTNRGLVRADSAAYRLQISTSQFRNEGVCEATNKAMLDLYSAPIGYGAGTLSGGTWVVRDSSLIVFRNAPVDTVNAAILLDGPASAIHDDYSGHDALDGFAKIGPQGDFTIMNRDYAPPGDLMVSGGLNIKPGCTFTVPDNYFQRGGQTAIEGTLTAANPIVIDYGRMIGDGVVLGDLVNDGWVSPGMSIDVLTVFGTYEQQEHGRLTIELAGTDPSEIDLLDVTGQATLDGMLEVVAADGFLVQPGDMFTVLTCSSRQGEFATVLGWCLAPGVCFDVEYGSDYVRLIAYGLDPADVGDDLVDLPNEIRFYTSSTSAAGGMLHLDLPAAAEVDLSIYDVSGRLVSKVWDGAEQAGSHTYEWNPNRGSSGIYFARVIVRGTDGAYTKTNRLWVVR